MGTIRRLIAMLPRRPIERLRLLMLALDLSILVLEAARILAAQAASWPLRGLGLGASLLLACWWLLGYRRRSFPAAMLPLEGLALLAFSAPLGGPLNVLPFLSLALGFRTLYGGWLGLLPCLAYGLTVAAGQPLAPWYTAVAVGAYTPVMAPFMIVVGLVMWLLAESLQRQEDALERQRLLTSAGAALVAAATRDDIVAAGVAAVGALLEGRTVRIVRGGEDEPSRGGLRLPLAGHGGLRGMLLVEGLEPLPEGSQQPLEALSTLIALRLEGLDEGRMRQEKAESRVDQLAELNQLKDELLNSVSYELRSPLTSIRAYSELLLTYQDAAVQREFLEIISSESERLARLVNDVLDLTHIQSGSFIWNMSAVDVPALLHDAARIYRPLIAREGLEFDVGAEDDLPPVHGDRDRLLQVLGNLLHNALKFTLRGSVGLAAYHAGEEIHIAVSDTGMGVPAAERERIFEKFRQAGSPPAGKAAGTGLGLAICRHIVEHHGGRIWLTPAPRGGSVFTFALPALARAAQAPAQDTLAEASSAQGAKLASF